MTPYRRLQNNLFGIRRSARYHERRRAFFEAVNTWILASQVTVSSSFGALVLLNSEEGPRTYSDVGVFVVALVGLLAALNLVVGSQRRAFLHSSLAQKFAQLEQDITPHEHDEKIGISFVNDFRRKRLAIEEGEPPKLRIIDLLSHNELVVSTYQHMTYYPISWCVRFVGHVIDMEPSEKLLEKGKPYVEMIKEKSAVSDTTDQTG